MKSLSWSLLLVFVLACLTRVCLSHIDPIDSDVGATEACESAIEGSVYLDETSCLYHKCQKGSSEKIVCPSGMNYDPSRGVCSWTTMNLSCSPDPTSTDPIFKDLLKCSLLGSLEEVGVPTPQESCEGKPFQLVPVPDQCDQYYFCIQENFQTLKCSADEIFNESNCVPKPHGHVCYTRGVKVCNEKGDGTVYFNEKECKYYQCDGNVPREVECTEPAMEFDPFLSRCAVGAIKPSCTHDKLHILPAINCTNERGGTLDTTFVGLVIDGSASMSGELAAIKQWITSFIPNPIDSANALAPTSGWILSVFSDPDVSAVVGPTTSLNNITAALDSLSGNTGLGGDCPEKAFEGILNAVQAVDEVNTGCKIFFFTDAVANDELYYQQVKQELAKKRCKLVPILSGCCGDCGDPDNFLDSAYWDHISLDLLTTGSLHQLRPAFLPLMVGEDFYYELANITRSRLVFVDKPEAMASSTLLALLQQHLTLGFCPTTKEMLHTTEADCVAAFSCWDRLVEKCFCADSKVCP